MTCRFNSINHKSSLNKAFNEFVILFIINVYVSQFMKIIKKNKKKWERKEN